MKRSWKYRLAQYAVLEYQNLSNGEKMDILRELISDENLALFAEKQEAEKKKQSEECKDETV